MNKILKDLLNNIIDGLYDHPLTIKDKVHILHISTYSGREERNNDWVKKQWKRAISIPVFLPITPKIGDYIEIPFTRTSYSSCTDDKYSYGYVYNVRHTIRRTIQEILISSYPHEKIYYEWEEMKNEYEEHNRWLARLKVEKDRI